MIYIMRHGESVVNLHGVIKCKQRDGALTAEGRRQAENASRWFAERDIATIYHSPFQRTTETAEIVSEIVDVAIQPHDGLAEVDCGDLEGLSDQTAWDAWIEIFVRWRRGDWDARYPGGESFRDAYNRISNALRLPGDDENTLLITHGGVTLAVIPYLCVNAAALQRISGLNYTGIAILERYDLERFICHSWDLKEHIDNPDGLGEEWNV